MSGPEVVEALPWMNDAACLGMDPVLFFPERGASTREAKATCFACPVRVTCLEYALDTGEQYGIWGGASERERRRIRRERAKAGRPLPARRQETCPNGHPRTAATTRLDAAGRRHCVTCEESARSWANYGPRGCTL